VPELENVTGAGSCPPVHHVPEVTADHSPQKVIVVLAGTVTTTVEPVTASCTGLPTVPQVVWIRAYDPPVTSLAPVLPGSPVCRLIQVYAPTIWVSAPSLAVSLKSQP
jgi:hypothetical protein